MLNLIYENCTSICKRCSRKNKICSGIINRLEKLLLKLKKYEQALKVKTELKESFEEVEQLRRAEKKKQTLNGFLNEL